MNIGNNPRLRDKLAAEYALGTLRGGARRRFEHWMQRDKALRAAVAEWQANIACIAEFGRPASPPARVWEGIERRLWGGAPRPSWAGWWTGATRPWAVLAISSSLAAIALAVVLAGRGMAPASLPLQVAALTDAQAHTGVIVTADTKAGRIDVRLAEDVRVPLDRTLQLWAIPRAGHPRSLGILAGKRSASLTLDRRAMGADVLMLAISLEPKGGSPNPNGPTGPVLYKGSWSRM